MVPMVEQRALASSRPVSWRGRSGRYYALSPERLDRFALSEGEIYLVALGNNVLWVGSARDVIDDHQSRSRFRLALDCADRVYRIDEDAEDGERMSMVWDLEGAEPVASLAA